MSTNKREESEGLVPTQRNVAMNYWHKMKANDRDDLKNIYNCSQAGTYGSFDEFIDYVWMQEVVLPYFSGSTKYYADKEDLAALYLKEHTVKEHWLWYWGNDQADTTNHSKPIRFDDFDAMKVFSADHSAAHKKHNTGYWSSYDKIIDNSVKEESGIKYGEENFTGKYTKEQNIKHTTFIEEKDTPVDETVRQAFERHVETVYGRPSEYNRMYGHHLRTFEDGSVWQKQQDRALIQSLYDALKIQMTSLFTYGSHPLIESQCKSAITKAEQFLK